MQSGWHLSTRWPIIITVILAINTHCTQHLVVEHKVAQCRLVSLANTTARSLVAAPFSRPHRTVTGKALHLQVAEYGRRNSTSLGFCLWFPHGCSIKASNKDDHQYMVLEPAECSTLDPSGHFDVFDRYVRFWRTVCELPGVCM
jgi:hypothetical protein